MDQSNVAAAAVEERVGHARQPTTNTSPLRPPFPFLRTLDYQCEAPGLAAEEPANNEPTSRRSRSVNAARLRQPPPTVLPHPKARGGDAALIAVVVEAVPLVGVERTVLLLIPNLHLHRHLRQVARFRERVLWRNDFGRVSLRNSKSEESRKRSKDVFLVFKRSCDWQCDHGTRYHLPLGVRVGT